MGTSASVLSESAQTVIESETPIATLKTVVEDAQPLDAVFDDATKQHSFIGATMAKCEAHLKHAYATVVEPLFNACQDPLSILEPALHQVFKSVTTLITDSLPKALDALLPVIDRFSTECRSQITTLNRTTAQLNTDLTAKASQLIAGPIGTMHRMCPMLDSAYKLFHTGLSKVEARMGISNYPPPPVLYIEESVRSYSAAAARPTLDSAATATGTAATSDSTTGTSDSTTGTSSASTPGTSDSTPATSDSTPGTSSDSTPGTSDSTPGTLDSTPGTLDSTPGTSGSSPATLDSTPGTSSDSTPGTSSDSTPRTSDPASETSDSALGTSDPASGTSDPASETSDSALGTSDSAPGTSSASTTPETSPSTTPGTSSDNSTALPIVAQLSLPTFLNPISLTKYTTPFGHFLDHVHLFAYRLHMFLEGYVELNDKWVPSVVKSLTTIRHQMFDYLEIGARKNAFRYLTRLQDQDTGDCYKHPVYHYLSSMHGFYWLKSFPEQYAAAISRGFQHLRELAAAARSASIQEVVQVGQEVNPVGLEELNPADPLVQVPAGLEEQDPEDPKIVVVNPANPEENAENEQQPE